MINRDIGSVTLAENSDRVAVWKFWTVNTRTSAAKATMSAI